MRTIQIENEKALAEIICAGFIPAVKSKIALYESEDNLSLYNLAFEIGEICDTYHRVMQTGNMVNREVKKNK